MNKFKLNDPVIYRLLKSKRVVYVGKSTSIISRLSSHKSQNEKDYDEVEFCQVKPLDLAVAEFIEILIAQPEYNKQLPTFSFCLYRTAVESINKALSAGNIDNNQYPIESPTLTVSLNGNKHDIWRKIGHEKEFDAFADRIQRKRSLFIKESLDEKI